MDTMRRQGLSIGTKFGLIIALGTVLILAVTGTVIYQQVKLQDEAQTQELTAATVEHIRAAVGIVFGGAMDVLNATNDNLVTFKDDGIVDPQVYDTILKRMLDSNRFGAWLIWDAGDAPARGGSAGGALDAGLSIYWHRNGMDMLREPVPADIIESDLYRVPRTRNHAYLFAPHLIEAVAGDPTLVVSISQPLAHDGRTVGVIAVDIKLDSIVDGLKAIGLPAGASMTVISDDGVIAMSSDGTEPGTPIASADRNLRRIFDQARRGDGYEIGAGADAQSKLYTSWSRISVATVDDAWYLVMRMPERSLLATTSNGRNFLFLAATVATFALLALVCVTMHQLVASPLKRLSIIINGLGKGLFDFDVPGCERADEVGDIARGVEHLQQSALQIARLQEENGERAFQHQRERQSAIDGISARFSRSIETMVAALDSAAATVETRSREVSTRAGDAVRSLESMSALSGAARSSMAAAAVATSSLLETVGSIGDRTRKGEAVSAKVERLAASADASISHLKTTIDSIDKVAGLISNVASQINLIALNATIEAARAGEAGQGFAVVAQEIKTLASQTARATDEISLQIAKVQNASGATNANVAEMSKAFDEKRSISSEIAGALEVQFGATGAISSVLEEAMNGADSVAEEMSALVESTQKVKGAADVMQSQSGLFNQEISGLKREVAAFLEFLKAA